MNVQAIDQLRCPHCSHALRLGNVPLKTTGSLESGELSCTSCLKKFPVRNFIPRFVASENYASSFGYQWNQYRQTQLDSFNGTTISRDRFYKTTKWPSSLSGEMILEVGSGAGRFTQVAAQTGAELFTVDYSEAIDANRQNNGESLHLHYLQADIYHLPLRENSFDKIFCLGVLQHCPDVAGAFRSLVKHLKPGGEIVVDVYKSTWKRFFLMYYWLRPFTRHLPKQALHDWLKRWIPMLLPASNFLGKIPLLGNELKKSFPVANYSGIYPLKDQQLLEWSILDTFDRLSPEFDYPQSLASVKSWFDPNEFEEVDVHYGENGIVARGIKRPEKKVMETTACAASRG